MGGRLSGRGYMYTYQHNIKLKLNYPPIKFKKREWTCGDRAVIWGRSQTRKETLLMPGRGAVAGAEGVLRFLMKDTFGTDHEGRARVEPRRDRPGG